MKTLTKRGQVEILQRERERRDAARARATAFKEARLAAGRRVKTRMLQAIYKARDEHDEVTKFTLRRDEFAALYHAASVVTLVPTPAQYPMPEAGYTEDFQFAGVPIAYEGSCQEDAYWDEEEMPEWHQILTDWSKICPDEEPS